MGLARRHQQSPVGAQRQRLWPHARQLDLQPGRREDLIGRGVVTVRAHAAHDVLGGSLRDAALRRCLTAREHARDNDQHA